MPEPEIETISKSTPLVLIWALATLLWSIFTPPSRTFPARTLLFQPAWLLRAFRSDSTWLQDLTLSLCTHAAYAFWTGAWKRMTVRDLSNLLDLENADVKLYLQVFALLGGCAVLAGTIVYRGASLDSRASEPSSDEERIDESLLDPLLIPAQTTHSRLFPQKHSFSYSYLLVGIPVGFHGRIGDVLSIDSPRRAWFDVRSADYLDMGKGFPGFGEKLKRFLHSHGVTDRDYAFAYLVTAPRFLGYSFNPVSFWYVYDSDVNLAYMILEVNNTFGERRMYLLRANEAKDASSADAEFRDTNAIQPSLKTFKFSDAFEKDFHVSPFNSRKGSYSLRAVDPFAAFQETGSAKIDNTIVLRSSGESPKIVARVSSEGAPRDPASVSTLELYKFIIGWWWVGFLTFPRIIWEAQKLFFRKKLHVWLRPEVKEGSLGRSYMDEEHLLESCFLDFLTHTVEHARKPLRVIYEPVHKHTDEIVLYSPGFTYEEDKTQTLTLKVLTPAFYSRFIHYAHAKEAFDRECLSTHEKNRTIVVEPPHVLPALLEAINEGVTNSGSKGRKISIVRRLRWNLLRRLRCPPAAASYSNETKKVDQGYTVKDIRAFRLSELDRYVQIHREDREEYRRVLAKLFIAEGFLFGIPGFVMLADIALRSAIMLAAMIFCNNTTVFDVLRPRPFKNADILPGALALLLANGVHIWSLFKG